MNIAAAATTVVVGSALGAGLERLVSGATEGEPTWFPAVGIGAAGAGTVLFGDWAMHMGTSVGAASGYAALAGAGIAAGGIASSILFD